MHLCCSLFQVWSPYWNVQKCIIMGFLIRSKNVRSRTPILKGSKYILYQLYDTNRQTLWVSIWLRFKKRFSLYYYWFVFFQVRSSSVKAYSTIEQKCGNIVGYIKRKYNDQHLKTGSKLFFVAIANALQK